MGGFALTVKRGNGEQGQTANGIFLPRIYANFRENDKDNGKSKKARDKEKDDEKGDKKAKKGKD